MPRAWLDAQGSEYAMQTLSKLDQPGENFVGGVRFTMIDGLVRVVCWITSEALDIVDRGNPKQDRIESLERQRIKIEHLARKK